MSKTRICIVGSGHTAFGRFDGRTLEELIVEAAREALESAQVDVERIDAVFLGHFNSGLVKDGFASSLVHQADPALRFTPATRCENACASGAAAIFAGMNAIRAGEAETVSPGEPLSDAPCAGGKAPIIRVQLGAIEKRGRIRRAAGRGIQPVCDIHASTPDRPAAR